MRRTSFAGMSWPVAQSLEVIGDPWTMLVVGEAFFGTTRFDDLQRNLGIPRTRGVPGGGATRVPAGTQGKG